MSKHQETDYYQFSKQFLPELLNDNLSRPNETKRDKNREKFLKKKK